jgi:hypothetical protein
MLQDPIAIAEAHRSTAALKETLSRQPIRHPIHHLIGA